MILKSKELPMLRGHQYIRHLIDNLQDLLVIYSSITNSLFPFCQWNWQYFFSPDGTLGLASWFSPCCLITGPYSKYHHVWPSSVGNTWRLHAWLCPQAYGSEPEWDLCIQIFTLYQVPHSHSLFWPDFWNCLDIDL